MLHDPGSYAPPQKIREITLGQGERDTLRKLGEELAVVAAFRFTEKGPGCGRS